MSDVTCAWCARTVEMGECHGEGVCTVSVPFVVDTSRIDVVLSHAARESARRFDERMLAERVRTPMPPMLLSADTPLVSRSPHVPSRSTAYVLDGSMFADDRLRVVLSESVSSEIVEAVREQLENRARQADLLEWVDRLLRFHPDGTPKPPPPAPMLTPWQREIIARVASGERIPVQMSPRGHGRSFVDRVLSEVCTACRTVGGHAPTCVTHIEPLLGQIEGENRDR